MLRTDNIIFCALARLSQSIDGIVYLSFSIKYGTRSLHARSQCSHQSPVEIYIARLPFTYKSIMSAPFDGILYDEWDEEN